MARYYFHVVDGRVIAAFDREGCDLDDIPDAVFEAVTAGREVLADGYRQGRCRRHWEIKVFDEIGDLAFSVPFSDLGEPDRRLAASEATRLAR